MKTFEQLISSKATSFHRVVNFDIEKDKILSLDFTAENTELTNEILDETDSFSKWVNNKLLSANARYGIGGYNEHRTIYSRSAHFNTLEEPRRLHLGVDIWGEAGTPIYNFYNATVHSFANNNTFGDYGATIILTYNIDDLKFNVLYGHLSAESLNGLEKDLLIPKGKKFASLGVKEENGFWPPHLHFQVIYDMNGLDDDYPGVCKFSERDQYLTNCPDPYPILVSTFGKHL
ncbi:peptidoglycan DD-metalloendopeptidase family protein [Pedobacter agri]|uniref:peptidoglycan DD-metalloendopeptidase family protein n=1 Tax=Pedobacter agri TaxID=454586 RepID=UPI00292EB00C|nr:peptidoglycan DD-metalloendopeptidase family protein [Pedobacter agri]